VTAPPRDASTVVLLRDDALGRGLQVWLMHRIDTLAFAAGAHVFPGGSVDPSDSERLPLVGGELAEVADVMGAAPHRAEALLAAAVRETFEECGLVLASGPKPLAWSDTDRDDLLAGRVSVASLLRRDDAVVDLRALLPWAWWLTPDFIPRRYDTWFFVSHAPEGLEPEHVGDGEAVAARWWGVDEALEANRAGSMMLLPPTLGVLTELAARGSVSEVMANAPQRLEQRSG
jgi:8-oxo-dGTP pyrophosphatase MutT (NUDIX family)